MTASRGRYRNSVLAPLTVGINLFMILFALFEMAMRKIDTMPPLWAMNAGIDFVGMIVGCVILICCYVDMQRIGMDQRYFRYLVEATTFSLFTDLSAWMMKDQARFWMLNRIDNTVFFLVSPVTVYFFWRYVAQIIGRDDPRIGRAEILLKAGLFVEIFMVIINFWFGFFFTVDKNSSYRRGHLYPVFMLYSVVVTIVIIALIVANRKKLHRRQIIALVIYLGTPLPLIIVAIFVYGLSLNYIMCMLDTLVMYGVLSVEQGREKMAVNKELSTAASSQEGMLPRSFPLFPDRNEFELHASMDPAKEVGGDFYDAFLIDEDHLAIVMADVSGKGVPAALFMVIAKTLIKNRSQMGGTPAEILADVNDRLCEGNDAKLFVTVWLGILTVSTGHVIEANAGHENPVIRRGDGAYEELKRKHGFVCGGKKKMRYRDDEFDLHPGDILFVYTDGVSEATNGDGVRYGTNRMLTALNEAGDQNPEELLKAVRKDVDVFVKTAPQFDDLTMLAVRYLGAGT